MLLKYAHRRKFQNECVSNLNMNRFHATEQQITCNYTHGITVSDPDV
jgi:hypothetical protein